MKYQGVAHYLCANPELEALYRHGKSYRFLPEEHKKSVDNTALGDFALSPIERDDPAQAMADAVAMCDKQGLERGYAMIKRTDGHYFTAVDQVPKLY